MKEDYRTTKKGSLFVGGWEVSFAQTEVLSAIEYIERLNVETPYFESDADILAFAINNGYGQQMGRAYTR